MGTTVDASCPADACLQMLLASAPLQLHTFPEAALPRISITKQLRKHGYREPSLQHVCRRTQQRSVTDGLVFSNANYVHLLVGHHLSITPQHCGFVRPEMSMVRSQCPKIAHAVRWCRRERVPECRLGCQHGDTTVALLPPRSIHRVMFAARRPTLAYSSAVLIRWSLRLCLRGTSAARS